MDFSTPFATLGLGAENARDEARTAILREYAESVNGKPKSVNVAD